MAVERLIVGMTGATGVVFGVRLLAALKDTPVETHLIVSKWAQRNLEHETKLSPQDLRDLASFVHAPGDMGAVVSSGSYRADAMVVIPCSAASLAAIAHGTATHLVHRAADVTLKERRPLVLVVRETPLSPVHLENMLKLARLGVIILPPLPAFYNHPKSIDDIVDHVVARTLDQLGIAVDFARRWDGKMRSQAAKQRPPAAAPTGA